MNLSPLAGEDLPVVKVVTPISKASVRQIELPGSFEPLADVALYAKATGYLEILKVDIGDRIKKGELICRIAAPELVADLKKAEARLDLESHRLDLARLTGERLEGLLKDEPVAVTRQQVDEAQAEIGVANARLEEAGAELQSLRALVGYLEISAPFNGVLTERKVDPGDFIKSAASGDAAPVGRLMNDDSIRIFVYVPEESALLLSTGDPASVSLDAMPGGTFQGLVSRFAGALNPDSRTMRTEIRLPNADHKFRPGMYAHVKLSIKTGGATLAVPSSAVSQSGQKAVVYVVRDQTLHLQEVKTGYDDGKTVEIVSGLEPADKVVVSGRQSLKTGQAVTVVQSSLESLSD
ncbi:MAG: hypothetical protein A3F83_06555 [Candidatus Glassbacteria bacterium RIFCSPLOWO2_12_FULL_58_11]|uniref:Uncharacterized protein n=1 Tax=Candidatus Glassbacteria bacterium RIFCSPLOWO2_12_FULL_58_11 TaxID=1817867 RepID=A0A1F5YSF7_9BACT|nr:MAG: hypothetical protein A3F83_06555 [Candidatus Glassbacteria bacterium RIFCSPLOWO2_12_FULL_58_11]